MKKNPFVIGELDQYYFGNGIHYEIQKKLGAHPLENGRGASFAVWAPHAAQVFLIGDFNDWNEESLPMLRREPIGIYEIVVPGARVGDLYKFLIVTKDGRKLYKADPFAAEAEVRPGTASRIADLSKIRWSDEAWLADRAKTNLAESPMSIYEVHPGSWKRHPAGSELSRSEEGFYTYRQLAPALTKYVKSMGYTHVELMGILEYPYDGSWGYQVTGYFAPTSRYGSAVDFAYLVNYLHRNGIGVILDWVPAHFPKDAHGLAQFDGEPLFEYADSRKGEHSEWGTKVFDYGKNEVRNFLIASALYWVETFHVDGLRVDAVASMLYLDYGRKDGEWVPNERGGKENLEAVEFLKHMNSCLLGRNPGVVTIAEESTTWPMVTYPPEDGGLGFSLKWNMGWMHDFLEYMRLDPYFRKGSHNKMTFGLTYAYSENFVLVLSHDEVVHLKGSMLEKMPGTGLAKFQNLMVGYAFMIGHPGKKLLFMGQEFGQRREWSEERELDWELLEKPEHQNLQKFTAALNKLYKKNPALSEQDRNFYGFEWINCDDASRSVFSFIRHAKDERKNLLFICNFTPVARPEYRVGVPGAGQYRLVLSSNSSDFGGDGKPMSSHIVRKAVKSTCDGCSWSIRYPLAPYEAAIFAF